MSDKQPTEEGRRRWPPDGTYQGEAPCTCRPECPDPCNGQPEDGCKADQGCDACWSCWCDAEDSQDNAEESDE